MRRWGFLALWLGFIAYAFLLAPPDQPDTVMVIQQLSSGDWDGINPLIVALFNLMGLWPMIYSCLLYADGRDQKWPAWAFASGTFALGGFVLLPYLALRQPNPDFSGKANWWVKIWDSRWIGLAIALGVLTLLGYGILNGDWADFGAQWQSSRFIHVMSLDFCLLCLVFPALLGDDMARRGWSDRPLFWFYGWIPLLGAIAYLVTRPRLVGKDTTPQSSQPIEEPTG